MIGLGDYLLDAGTKSRVAGVQDCCTFPADWAVFCGHDDPMAAWRGQYATEAEGEALIDDAGGLDVLFEAGMQAAGIPEVEGFDFVEGDIAVVAILGEQAGSVFTGRRWAFVADRGLAFASLAPDAVLRAWRPSRG